MNGEHVNTVSQSLQPQQGEAGVVGEGVRKSCQVHSIVTVCVCVCVCVFARVRLCVCVARWCDEEEIAFFSILCTHALYVCAWVRIMCA